MAQSIIMPKLGQTVEEATIVKWRCKEGDTVKKGDVLYEIQTDKAVLDAESFLDGTLLKIIVNEGETVPVSTVVAYVGKKGENVPNVTVEAKKTQPPAPAPAPSTSDPSDTVRHRPPTAQPSPKKIDEAGSQQPKIAQQPSRLFISPRAKTLARESVIDPSHIRGTGPNGRIVVKDVEAYLQQRGYDKIRIAPAAKKLAVNESIDILKVKGTGESGRIMVCDVERTVSEKPKTMSRMRQVIAKRLTESFTTTPHFYVTVSIDMTDLFVLRKELKENGAVYTVTDFILESVILSLKEFPALNSVTDGKTVSWRANVDLGMAVGLEEGLVVPVIRNAEDLSMAKLHDAAQSLAARAREGKLKPDEITRSTFTVSNMGMLDVENFTAIINPGESAILAVGSTADKVVVMDGEMKIRSIMKITLSADHRIVDGTLGAGFVNAIRKKLEDMELWKSLT